jgi:DNA polymerase-1
MIAMQDWLSRQHSGARMILQVHDELILECPEQEVEQVQQALKQAMESVYPLNVPLVADVGIGRNWDEAKA